MTDRRIISQALSVRVGAASAGGAIPEITFSQLGVLSAPSVAYMIGPDGMTITGARGYLEVPSPTVPVTVSVYSVVQTGIGVYSDTPLGVDVTFQVGQNIARASASVSVLSGTLVYLKTSSPSYVVDAFNLRSFVVEHQ